MSKEETGVCEEIIKYFSIFWNLFLKFRTFCIPLQTEKTFSAEKFMNIYLLLSILLTGLSFAALTLTFLLYRKTREIYRSTQELSSSTVEKAISSARQVLQKNVSPKVLDLDEETQAGLMTPEEMRPKILENASPKDLEFMEKLTTFVEENLNNPDLNTKMLTSEMYMSRSLLYNKVIALTGMSIKEFVSKMRLAKVMNMLWHTEVPLGNIAECFGYGSSRYFSTSFKAVVGVSPSSYREAMRMRASETAKEEVPEEENMTENVPS